MQYVARLTQLLYAAQVGCTEEMLTIAAMTSVASPFTAFEYGPSMDVAAEISRRKFVAEEGDHLTLLNVYNAFVHPRIGQQSPKWAAKYALSYASLRRAQAIRAQLKKYVTLHWQLPLESSDDGTKVRKCLVAGLFKNAAQRMDDGSYRSARHNAVLHAHPSSVMFTRAPPERWVVFQEVTHTTKAMMRDITVIDQAWLLELAYVALLTQAPLLRTATPPTAVLIDVHYGFVSASERRARICAVPLRPCARNWRRTRKRLVRVVYCPAKPRTAIGRMVVRSRVADMWIVCRTARISLSTSW